MSVDVMRCSDIVIMVRDWRNIQEKFWKEAKSNEAKLNTDECKTELNIKTKFINIKWR